MSRPTSGSEATIAPGADPCTAARGTDRRVVDQLAARFPLDRSESEWLMTLLGAHELRYIFEGTHDDVND